MYVPAHFAMTCEQIEDALTTLTVADLVTATSQGPVASLLPFVHEPADDGFGRLITHVTRTNPVWRGGHLGEALVIVNLGDHYVTPSWRPSKIDPDAAVPTWNYRTMHIYGTLTAHDDIDWLREAVQQVTRRHEEHREQPWHVEDMTGQVRDRMLRAAVGLELTITRIEGKAKLSQNNSVADIEGIIAGLRDSGDEESAAVMEQISLPHAIARAQTLARVGREHDARRASGSEPA